MRIDDVSATPVDGAEPVDPPAFLADVRQGDTISATVDPALESAIREVIDAAAFSAGRRQKLLARVGEWSEQYEERAAILEFDAYQSRGEAEAQARVMVLESVRSELFGSEAVDE